MMISSEGFFWSISAGNSVSRNNRTVKAYNLHFNMADKQLKKTEKHFGAPHLRCGRAAALSTHLQRFPPQFPSIKGSEIQSAFGKIVGFREHIPNLCLKCKLQSYNISPKKFMSAQISLIPPNFSADLINNEEQKQMPNPQLKNLQRNSESNA